MGERFSRLERSACLSHLNVGHQFHLWSYHPIANVPDGVILKNAREILPEHEVFAYQVGEGKGSYSAFSNFFRYKLLLERGGWWVDADVMAIKRFEFDKPYVFASERDEHGLPETTTCVIYCPVGSDTMQFCWNRCQITDKLTVRWGTIGPSLLSEAVIITGKLDYRVRPDVFCPVDWFDMDGLFGNRDVSCSHGLHLWNEMWRRKGLDKEKQYPRESLYERVARGTKPILLM